MSKNHQLSPEDQELSDFLELIQNDVTLADEELEESDTPSRRRAFIRTVFASIEGMISILQAECLGFSERYEDPYSEAELAILREEAYSIDSRGRAQIRPNYAPLDARLRFVIPAYMRPHVSDFSLDLSGDGWQAFLEALSVRHRITHPKSLSDLDVTEDDLETTRKAFAWFMHEVLRNLVLAVRTLVDEIKERGIFDDLFRKKAT